MWVFGAAVVLGGTLSCGPVEEVPLPDAEKQASIAQLVEMLSAGGNAPAAEALAERLDSLCRFPPAESASRALADALVRATAERPIGHEAGERLARQLYAVMNGGYLRRARLEALANEIARELRRARVPAAAAADVREAGIRVAREPRNPRTDWW